MRRMSRVGSGTTRRDRRPCTPMRTIGRTAAVVAALGFAFTALAGGLARNVAAQTPDKSNVVLGRHVTQDGRQGFGRALLSLVRRFERS